MKFKYILILVLSLLLLPSEFIFSQANTNYGSLTGKITDSKTGQPLPGVNVILVQTVLGASSNLDGNFFVNKIRAGKYQVKATMMGYKAQTIQVDIQAGGKATIDFKLEETAIETPTLIVTASKKAQSFQDVPNSVSLISLKEIERRNKTYLNDVLEYTPGVYIMRGDVNIRGSSGFSLGAGSRVLLLVDGIPMMPGDSGDIKWDIVPMSQIERVEIVKGAGSALYGSQALGGVINIITKEPTSKPTTHFQYSIGLYDKPYYPEWNWTDRRLDFNQFDVTHSQSWSKLSVLLSGGRKEGTGYQQNGNSNGYNLLGKIIYKFNSQSTFTLQSNWTSVDYGEIFLWRNQHDVYEMPFPAIGDWVNSNKFSTNAVFRQLLSSKFAYKIRTSYFHNDFQHYHHDNNDNSRAKKFGVELQADYLPNKVHTITTGVEGIYDFTRSLVWGDHESYTLAGYVQDELKLLKALSLTLGSRFDYHHVDTGEEDNQFNPKAGLSLRPNFSTAIRASIGRGFRAPTMAEMFTETFTAGFRVIRNPYLKPESAWSYEVGINQIISDKLIVDLALFHNDYKNFIEPEPDIYQTVQFTNVATARIRGFEITAQGSLWQRLLLFNAGYTYMDPEDLNTNEILAYRPRHLVTSGLTLSYSIFELGFDYRYISRLEKVKIYPNDKRVAQNVWDARIAAHLFGFNLAFNINNLFQYNYWQIERNIAPPRNFVFTVNREI